MLWDAQVFDLDGWIIPAGLSDDRKARALHYIYFATDTQRLADQAKYISYGPARASSAPLVGKHADLGIDMAPHMPTDPNNAKNTFLYNYEWWADYRDDLDAKFQAWIEPSNAARRAGLNRRPRLRRGRRSRRSPIGGIYHHDRRRHIRRPEPRGPSGRLGRGFAGASARRRRHAAEAEPGPRPAPAKAARAGACCAASDLRPGLLHPARSAICCCARWRTRSSPTRCRKTVAALEDWDAALGRSCRTSRSSRRMVADLRVANGSQGPHQASARG